MRCWGVYRSWVKMDWCHSAPQDPRTTYPKMSKALNSTGRPIHFNMCEWGVENPWEWYVVDVGLFYSTAGCPPVGVPCVCPVAGVRPPLTAARAE